MTAVVLVAVGGGAGAVLRWLTDRAVQRRHRWRLPLGTLTVNLVACLVLGVVAGGVAHAGWSPSVRDLLGTGLCGGLSTFSTFSVETVQLIGGRRPLSAAGYVLVSAAAGIALAAVGWSLT